MFSQAIQGHYSLVETRGRYLIRAIACVKVDSRGTAGIAPRTLVLDIYVVFSTFIPKSPHNQPSPLVFNVCVVSRAPILGLSSVMLRTSPHVSLEI